MIDHDTFSKKLYDGANVPRDMLLRIRQVLRKIYGSSTNLTIEHQMLLWILQYSSIIFVLVAINNYLLGIPDIRLPLVMGFLCFFGYLFVRRDTAWIHFFMFVPFGAYLLVTTNGWFGNAGILGGVPMFLSGPVLSAMALLRGITRRLMVVTLLVHLTVLTLYQWCFPEQVLPYADLGVKQIDLITSMLMSSLYGIGCIAILVNHLEVKRHQIEGLLLNVLPQPIAEMLQYQYTGEQIVAESYTDASVMFVDIVDFTALSAEMRPGELVAFLDNLFSHFDMLTDVYHVEKIKTIGDCYMVASGVPQSHPDHAQRLVRMALTIQNHMKRQRYNGRRITFRIGINSGSMVAGIIGKQRFAYDLWGDAVNVASRMESHGVPGMIQITEATYKLVAAHFVCVHQGLIPVKGKGEMPVWHVLAQNQSS